MTLVGWRLVYSFIKRRLSIDAIACRVILGVTYMHSAYCVLFIYWLHHVELVFLNISEDVLCLIGLILTPSAGATLSENKSVICN